MIRDRNFNDIIKLESTNKILLMVNGNIDIYKLGLNSDSTFELFSTTRDKTVYGLSCCSLIEVIGVLIQDYANGIITEAIIK